MILRPWLGTNKPPLGVRPIPGHPFGPNLALLLNEGAGSVVYDVVNRFSGIFQNDTLWQSGNVGWATKFDGTGDSILLDSYVPPLNGCTIVYGFKADSVARISSVFGQWNPVNAPTTRCMVHFPWSDGVLYWDYGGQTAGISRLSVAAPTGWLGNYHVAAVSATVGAGMSIWADGILLASHSGNTPQRASSTGFALGAAYLGFTFWYHANTVDWMMIYEPPLSPDVIQALMAQPFLSFGVPDLAAMWAAQARGGVLLLGSRLGRTGPSLAGLRC